MPTSQSPISSHREFHMELVHQLVQPLLSLKASCENPISYAIRGRKPVPAEKRLTGKHFAYKEKKKQNKVGVLCVILTKNEQGK